MLYFSLSQLNSNSIAKRHLDCDVRRYTLLGDIIDKSNKLQNVNLLFNIYFSKLFFLKIGIQHFKQHCVRITTLSIESRSFFSAECSHQHFTNTQKLSASFSDSQTEIPAEIMVSGWHRQKDRGRLHFKPH